MPTAEAFCKLIAKNLDLKEATLRNLLKELRRDNVIPMGVRGGGRNMPQMTAENCADFFIALCGTMNAKEAGNTVEKFGALCHTTDDGSKWTLKESFLNWIRIYRDENSPERSSIIGQKITFSHFFVPSVVQAIIRFSEDDSTNIVSPENITTEEINYIWSDSSSLPEAKTFEEIRARIPGSNNPEFNEFLTNSVTVDGHIFYLIAEFLGPLAEEVTEE